MAKQDNLPKYNELLNPLLQALNGQATVNSRRDPFSLAREHSSHQGNNTLGSASKQKRCGKNRSPPYFPRFPLTTPLFTL